MVKKKDLVASRTSKRVQAKTWKADQQEKTGLKKVGKSPQLIKSPNSDLSKKKSLTLTLKKSKTQENLIAIKTTGNSLNRLPGKKIVRDVKDNNSEKPLSSGEVKDSMENWKVKFEAEVDRRRNVQRDLLVEKDRNRQLPFQLQKEREENRTLNQQIGSLRFELSNKQAVQAHGYGGQVSTSFQAERWLNYVPHQPAQTNQKRPPIYD